MYLVWKQTASSAARQMCSLRVYCVKPTMAPRASDRHRGAYRPEKLKYRRQREFWFLWTRGLPSVIGLTGLYSKDELG